MKPSPGENAEELASQPSAAEFLRAVLRSELLSREQLQTSLRGVPKEQRDDPQALAEHLIKHGKLTRFQAQKLQQGSALGLLLGPFQVLAPIGRGGMGTVYLARDSRNEQLVALKILPPHREERHLARFRREMELCRRVDHPHLAWTYEVGVHQGVYYIAMEYIPGKSLYRLVSDEGRLEFRRAARLFAEVASALDYAHRQGLIHRDLKPSNLLVTPHDHVKVLDLGLALIQGEQAEREVIGGVGYVVGSMDYIAPEQTTDATAVDARSDIYGLGCTLYFALSGQPPFPGGTSREKIFRHRREEPVPLLERNPALPPAFAALVAGMMAKDPQRRFQTAEAVQIELTEWAQSEEVLPLDTQSDPAYQEAIASLETAEIIPEMVNTVVVVEAAEPPKTPDRVFYHRPVQLPSEPESSTRDFLWLGLGLLGFWVVVLSVVGLVLLLR